MPKRDPSSHQYKDDRQLYLLPVVDPFSNWVFSCQFVDLGRDIVNDCLVCRVVQELDNQVGYLPSISFLEAPASNCRRPDPQTTGDKWAPLVVWNRLLVGRDVNRIQQVLSVFPSEPGLVMSMIIRWFSVPPETTRTVSDLVNSSAMAAAFFTTWLM